MSLSSTVTLALFGLSVGCLIYVYAGYPLLVRIGAALWGRPVNRGARQPTVTFVITAYNEEAGIRRKLENVLALDYPPALLDVVVASDGSTDQTDELVRGFRRDRVRLLRVEGRLGKTACQNLAVEQATGELVVFSDATTRLDRKALLTMVANFHDPSVGCVAGCLVYEQRGANATAAGGTAYWGYEVGLRRAESQLGSLIGVSGCLYAVRRSAYRAIRPDLISDFVISMVMREQGWRTVLETGAVCFEDTLDGAGTELAMRIRVSIRSINALVLKREFLNPLRFGWFAWQLWSHKVLRYASPLAWAIALTSNALLLGHPLLNASLALQLLIIALGGAGFVAHGTPLRLGLLDKPYYFLLTNIASAMAIIRYARGDRMVTWKPVR
jgi:cellulose synthase/poly-beta-1,6-N-acetylglucosamine synthase-like glycosyltransferase